MICSNSIFEFSVQIIVAVAAVISAIYAGKSSKTAKKALEKENKELKEVNQTLISNNQALAGQNNILFETQAIFNSDLQLRHHPLYTFLDSRRDGDFLTVRLKNISGYSTIPRLESSQQEHLYQIPEIFRAETHNHLDLIITNEVISIKVLYPVSESQEWEKFQITLKYDNPNKEMNCRQTITVKKNGPIYISSRSLSKF